ncbi:MAG: hypothetical protein ACOCV2_09950 [Persicimonas sp.]
MSLFNRHNSLSLFLLASTLAFGAGCGEDVEPLGDGSLELTWEVAPRGCEDAGVEQIEARVTHGQRSYDERFACADGKGRVDEVEAGKYDVQLVGLDADEKETFISDKQRVVVNAEKTSDAPKTRLTAKPVDLEVSWRFDDGRVCGSKGVEKVEVAVYDPAYYELGRAEFACDAGRGTIDDLIAGEYTVEVSAEGDDEAVFHGLEKTTVKRGETGEVEVVLEVFGSD